MMYFSARRIFNVFLILAATILSYFIWDYKTSNLQPFSVKSGMILYALIISLVALNWRKKVPFLPLGRVATWLQIHIYIGFFTTFFYFIHVDFRWPNGLFESALALLFLSICASGFLGLAFSRIAPIRMTDRGGNIVFERIPELRREYQEEAKEIIRDSVTKHKKNTLADFYMFRISPFLEKRHHSLSHILNRTSHLKQFEVHFEGVRRYLNDGEREDLDRLKEIMLKKDILDYHEAHQRVLKLWLHFHLPASYALLLVGLAHGMLAYHFVGGAL